jgi:hypothetical protein
MKSRVREIGALIVAFAFFGSVGAFAEFMPPPPPAVSVGVGIGVPQMPPPMPYGGFGYGYSGYGGFGAGDHGIPGPYGFDAFRRHEMWMARRYGFLGRGACGAPWRHRWGGCGRGRRSFRSFSLSIGIGGFGFGLHIGRF